MNSRLSDADRKILQNSTPEESEQPSPIQTTDLEDVASGSGPNIPRPESTPTMKVQS
ncbi:MAG: hypothetical protein QOK38_2966 [Acidobacteriaceae bacterium]|jgi:hypothetical protein|nr:hypothetical protein [Acidobacteriaceae bacterium]